MSVVSDVVAHGLSSVEQNFLASGVAGIGKGRWLQLGQQLHEMARTDAVWNDLCLVQQPKKAYHR